MSDQPLGGQPDQIAEGGVDVKNASLVILGPQAHGQAFLHRAAKGGFGAQPAFGPPPALRVPPHHQKRKDGKGGNADDRGEEDPVAKGGRS